MPVKFGSAGANSYLSRTTGLPSSTSFTIMGWIAQDSIPSSWGQIFVLENGTSQYQLEIEISTNKLGVWNNSLDVIGSVLPITSGRWIHVAITASSTTKACGYINGVLDILNTSTGTTFSPAKMYIGGWNSNDYFTGSIADVRIWNRELSAHEIIAEMCSLKPVAKGALNSWYPLTTLSDLADHGPNGYALSTTGTIVECATPWPINAYKHSAIVKARGQLYQRTWNELFSGVVAGADLAATQSAIAAQASGLTTQIMLNAAQAAVATHAAAISTSIRPASSLIASATQSAAITAQIRLNANQAAISALSPNITTDILLQSAQSAGATVSANLAVPGAALQLIMSAQSAQSASVSTAITVAATMAATASGTYALTTGAGLAASASATASLSSAITTAIRAATGQTAAATQTAAVTTDILFATAQESTASINASITTSIRPAANFAATAAQVAALTAGPAFGVNAQCNASITASITTSIRPASVFAASASLVAALSSGAAQLATSQQTPATITAALTTGISLATAQAATGTQSAALSSGQGLAASAVCISQLSGSLTTVIRLNASNINLATLTASLGGVAASLAATQAAITAQTAAITAQIRIEAALSAQAAESAALTISPRFASAFISNAAMQAFLSVQPLVSALTKMQRDTDMAYQLALVKQIGTAVRFGGIDEIAFMDAADNLIIGGTAKHINYKLRMCTKSHATLGNGDIVTISDVPYTVRHIDQLSDGYEKLIYLSRNA